MTDFENRLAEESEPFQKFVRLAAETITDRINANIGDRLATLESRLEAAEENIGSSGVVYEDNLPTRIAALEKLVEGFMVQELGWRSAKETIVFHSNDEPLSPAQPIAKDE